MKMGQEVAQTAVVHPSYAALLGIGREVEWSSGCFSTQLVDLLIQFLIAILHGGDQLSFVCWLGHSSNIF